jgi:hypothetical protein
MTASHTVLVGVFNDRYQAELAVDELHQSGFPREEIGFALRGSDVDQGGTLTDAVGAHDAQGAVSGAVTGGVVGGLLGAAAALILPGVGPVIAYGVLATALGYAGAGAAVGGILGAMAGAGLTEEEAEFYQQQFDAGRAIVTVHAADREALASQIIHHHGGFDMVGYENAHGRVSPHPPQNAATTPDQSAASPSEDARL